MDIEYVAYGQTVADLRKLLRRAKTIALQIRTDMEGKSTPIFVKRGYLASAIKYKDDATPLPSVLYRAGEGRELTLSVGAISAVFHMRDQAAASANQAAE